MYDQLIIEKVASFESFGASIAERAIKAPNKKTIKETVPFSNVTYDFSAINGEVYWEERELKYVFEIIADTPAELEQKKTNFSKWVMNVMGENIYDPYDPDYHYVGTFESIDYADEDCVEKSTITVTFLAYPYKIANAATNTVCAVPALSTESFVVFNDSGHRITPTIETDCEIIIEFDGKRYSASAGTFKDDVLKLKPGTNILTIQNLFATDGTVTVSYTHLTLPTMAVV